MLISFGLTNYWFIAAGIGVNSHGDWSNQSRVLLIVNDWDETTSTTLRARARVRECLWGTSMDQNLQSAVTTPDGAPHFLLK